MAQYWPTNVLLTPPGNTRTPPEAEIQHLVWTIAGIFVAVSIISSTLLIRGHLNHFTQPIVQSKIVGILWMVPIYATDSWLSLRFKNAALYLDLMRDSYEGYVIYLFLALMIAYISKGSNEEMIAILNTLPAVQHPWPVKKWVKPIGMGSNFLKHCKMATMQFVVLKPLMALVAIGLQFNHMYDQGNFSTTKGYVYISLVVNLSITYAFYYLVLFYMALCSQLAPYHPVPKFLCIKIVLFLSFWQSVVLAFLSRFEIIHQLGSWSVENVTTGIQNLLICFEMSFVAIAHHRAFPYEPYKHGNPALRTNILADYLAFEDAVRDFNEVMPVVLPTPFKPGAETLKTKKHYQMTQSNEQFSSETVRLLTDGVDQSKPSNFKSKSRGWKL
ncbi:Predicted seven transmembrane receptor-rhodopsin family [Plasmopara halstedii]|uniref:Predicted seven transmembrane receptor-rhodopsin family n=1 Tax=Plasmopara halstedii TaxID=4781 RepID=A0A0P1A5D4_PLAHL|nr:Predicted seven transmembrane receptor-rhodopsin family [Plasmopara halstedii]CEG35300.1 Predicted seven transmembrane receptor-rhodopsin family [Plasmopara halstedii]|eukprot:XP_024571669.1 Predicted seven transmembrane receptor-rhodopsin family [Plasmopara halstedii]